MAPNSHGTISIAFSYVNSYIDGTLVLRQAERCSIKLNLRGLPVPDWAALTECERRIASTSRNFACRKISAQGKFCRRVDMRFRAKRAKQASRKSFLPEIRREIFLGLKRARKSGGNQSVQCAIHTSVHLA